MRVATAVVLDTTSRRGLEWLSRINFLAADGLQNRQISAKVDDIVGLYLNPPKS